MSGPPIHQVLAYFAICFVLGVAAGVIAAWVMAGLG